MASFMKEAFSADGSFPPDMLEWRTMAERLRLDYFSGWDVVLAARAKLAASGPTLPFGSSRVTPAEAHHLALGSPNPAAMRAMWSASRTDSRAPRTSAAEYLFPAHELFAKDPLLKATRRRPAQFSRTGKTSVRTHNKLQIARIFSKLGPARKIRLLENRWRLTERS